MTKLKNTKKGMAKKALSISLVAAMLATSNVPVWAAEDLFSDGSAAVEAPVVEEPAAEVDTFSAEPVEETNTNDVATYAATEATLKLDDWNSKLSVSGDIKDAEGNILTGEVEWEIRINGREVVDHNGKFKNTCDVKDLNTSLSNAGDFKATDAGSTVSLKLSKADGFYTELGSIEIKSVDITGKSGLDLNGAELSYTGKQVQFTDKQIAAFKFEDDLSGFKYSDFSYTYEGEDLVNATKDGKYVTLVATVNKTGYTGAIRVQGIQIQKREIKAENLEVTLNKDSVSFAERSSISSDIVTVKDKETGDIFPASTYSVKANTTFNNAGDSAKLTITFDKLSKDEMIGRNYKVGSNSAKTTDEKVKLTANNISDFKIITDSVKRGSNIDTAAKDAIHFYLGDKEVTDAVKNAIIYKSGVVQDNATSVDVSLSGDNKNVIGNTTVTLQLTTNSVKDIDSVKVDGKTITRFSSNNELDSMTYTGEELTKKITNVKIGDVTLTEGKEYTIEYENDNINANAVSKEKVYVNLVGTGDYSGKVTLGYFIIDQAEIKSADIKVPESVLYDGSIKDVEEYMNGKVSIQASTKINGESKKIDVPVDAYSLTYSLYKNAPLAVGSEIVTTLESDKITNANFKINGDSISASKRTMISNKSLSDENVKVEVIGGPYTYTGKAVVPTLKVTVDGVELAPNRDYEIKTSANSVDAGTASVTVVGINDYSGSQTVNYVINKANLSDVKAEANVDKYKNEFTYTGKQVKPLAEYFNITLNGVELNSEDFAITYPTSSFTNVDAGEATVTLVPVKGNENFTGDKLEVKFNILPAELTTSYLNGTFYAFDENGNKIDFNSNYTFAYDGTEKTFKDIEFIPSKADYKGVKLVEGKDYEIKYFNNITGPEAYVYVVGIGNYTGSEKFDGSETTYTVRKKFNIEGVTIDQRNVVLKDTEYAGGVGVTPNLTITVGSKTLVEGTDYEFINLKDNVDVTPTNKVLTADLKFKGGYKLDTNEAAWSGAFDVDAATKTVKVTWKIVKKDLANTTITAVEESNDINVTVMNGNVIVPETEYDVKDNGDGTVTVTAKADSKGYTGSQKVTVEENDVAVGAPVITEVQVNGNKATVILEGEAEGATGYDYVISTVNNYTDGRLSNGINKNQLATQTSYQYLDQGIYYAYCHAWTRDENGNKVFGEWSNIMPFSVSSITPDQPSITKVEKSSNGKHLRVTWTKSANATGYDVVMGTKVQKVNGEYRPVEYGKAVKKVTNGNTVSVIFYNIPKGTYYVGLHAYNRTSETGVKVFSPWSNSKKVTF